MNQIKSIPSTETASVNQIKDQRNSQQQPPRLAQYNQNHSKTCKYCGFNLPHNTHDEECPAKGKDCSHCGIKNHFSKVCRKRKHGTTSQPQRSYQDNTRQVKFVTEDYSSDEEQGWTVNAIVKKINKSINHIFMPTVFLVIFQTSIRFNIDTGCQVDIIDEHSYHKLKKQTYLIQV